MISAFLKLNFLIFFLKICQPLEFLPRSVIRDPLLIFVLYYSLDAADASESPIESAISVTLLKAKQRVVLFTRVDRRVQQILSIKERYCKENVHRDSFSHP